MILRDVVKLTGMTCQRTTLEVLKMGVALWLAGG